MNENCPPGGIAVEFQPVASDVDVCDVPSVFLHVTVVPASTVRSAGEKARLPRNSAPDGIVTADDGPPITGGGAAEGEVGVIGVDEPPPPQAEADAMRASMIAKRRDDIKSSRRTANGAHTVANRQRR